MVTIDCEGICCRDAKRAAVRDPSEERGEMHTKILARRGNLRDLSCLLRCSLLEKARLQNWHLYFFSGSDDFLICDDDAVGRTFMAATGIFGVVASGLDARPSPLFLPERWSESSGARAWA